MSSNDEVFNKLLKGEIDFVVLDDEHLLVRKTMDVMDDNVQEYVERLRRAKEEGVNVISIVDYVLLDKHKKRNSNTLGLYVTDLPIGSTFPSKNVININRRDNVKQKCFEYIRQNKLYLEELERRSKADSKYYIKLVEDIIKLHIMSIKCNSTIYNDDKGFIINSSYYPIGSNIYHTIAIQVLEAILGKGRPVIYMRDTYIECLPKEYVDRYVSLYESIIPKIMIGLIKNDVHTDFINKAISRYNRLINYTGYIVDNKETLEELINNNLKARVKK